MTQELVLALVGGAGVVLVALIAASVYTVEQQTVAIIQRWFA